MILLESSAYDASSIGQHLGKPSYSYSIVRKAFGRILSKLGIPIPISDSAPQIDRIFESARANGESCLHLAYAAPNNITTTASCPTIPVFAWEFDTIPTETWDGDPRNDWRVTLKNTPIAITHSTYAVQATKRAMGESYPIVSAPAPLYSEYSRIRSSAEISAPKRFKSKCMVFDSRALDFSIFAPNKANEAGRRAMEILQHSLDADAVESEVTLDGVIYTAVFNPVDFRKNWLDMVAGFIRTFRNVEDVTLILKLAHHSLISGTLPVLRHLQRLRPFKCRVLALCGMLSDDDYKSLIDVTTYAVNTSTAEGQCLPLMEYMSAGRPAIAPRHSALLDYVDDGNAFVVRAHAIPGQWPDDPRRMVRCIHHRVSVVDLQRAFKESYEVAKSDPSAYRSKSDRAREALRNFCSDEIVESRLREVIKYAAASLT